MQYTSQHNNKRRIIHIPTGEMISVFIIYENFQHIIKKACCSTACMFNCNECPWSYDKNLNESEYLIEEV